MASAKEIQQLRKETGAGIMAVKEALEEAAGDIEKARDALRKKGAAIAAKKGERETGQGAVFSYVHAGGRIGVLLKLYCETDFVARTDEFGGLGQDLVLHIAALDPQYILRKDVPAEVIEKEEEIYTEQARSTGKEQDVVGKVVAGKLEKFFQEVVLLEQKFVKDPDKTVQQRIEAVVAQLGENIQVGEFVRFEL
jgi:elongation factor Ts